MVRILSSRGWGAVATPVPVTPTPPWVNIPLSLTDPRFANNVDGTGVNSYTIGNFTNLNYNENPTYPNGNQCFTWLGAGPTANLSMSQFTVDWREGPRLAGDLGATFNVDQFFINCVGFDLDHADGIQAFNPGATGILNVTNTCFRSYDTAEAQTIYGPTAVGSDALFWADTYSGTLKFLNVLVWGGDRGVTVFADPGCTVHIDFQNVYFAPSTLASFHDYKYLIASTGGTVIIDNWINVCNATIVGNTVVPGSQLPHP